MNSRLLEDIEKGSKEEIRVKPILEKHFNLSLTKTKQNNVFDYENESNLFELKSRNNEYSKYPDTMIGTNKVEYARKSSKNVYFVFSFTNGLYYWKFDPEKELIQKTGGRKDRGRYEYKSYSYIPIDWLIQINCNELS